MFFTIQINIQAIKQIIIQTPFKIINCRTKFTIKNIDNFNSKKFKLCLNNSKI